MRDDLLKIFDLSYHFEEIVRVTLRPKEDGDRWIS